MIASVASFSRSPSARHRLTEFYLRATLSYFTVDRPAELDRKLRLIEFRREERDFRYHERRSSVWWNDRGSRVSAHSLTSAWAKRARWWQNLTIKMMVPIKRVGPPDVWLMKSRKKTNVYSTINNVHYLVLIRWSASFPTLLSAQWRWSSSPSKRDWTHRTNALAYQLRAAHLSRAIYRVIFIFCQEAFTQQISN